MALRPGTGRFDGGDVWTGSETDGCDRRRGRGSRRVTLLWTRTTGDTDRTKRGTSSRHQRRRGKSGVDFVGKKFLAKEEETMRGSLVG